MGKKVKEYKTGDFIFAKVKGYPAWPARVQKLNGKKYFVYFYGTGETANLPSNMIFDYAENKDKFLTKNVKRRDFNDGVKQIEHDFANNVPLEQVIGAPLEAPAEGEDDTANDTGNDTMEDSAIDTTAADETVADTTADTQNATQNDTAVEDSDETGALVIDEGKQPKNRKSKPAAETPKTPKTPKRGKAKKDEKTEEVPDTEEKEELVSRSGRKIRPKRYIDEQTEENTTLPSPAPKKRRGTSPAPEKEKEKEAHKEKKEDREKDKSQEKNIKNFNNVSQLDLEDLKEPFKSADPEKENILIACLPSSQYVGIKLFQSRPASFKDESARLQWDKQAAKNAITLKIQLERGQITPQSILAQLVMDLNLTDEEKATLDKERETEEKKSRVSFLKTEMKLIDLDARIKSCLSLEKADAGLCLKLLDELMELDVKPLMLLKHPCCLETVKRMRAYVGNASQWQLSEDDALQFATKAHNIRKQAETLYKRLKELFTVPDGLSFWEYFSHQVQQFQAATASLSADQLLEMVHEPPELFQPSAVTMQTAIDAANKEDPPLEEDEPPKKKNAKTKKTANNNTPSKPAAKRQNSRQKQQEEKEKEAEKMQVDEEPETKDAQENEKQQKEASETPKETNSCEKETENAAEENNTESEKQDETNDKEKNDATEENELKPQDSDAKPKQNEKKSQENDKKSSGNDKKPVENDKKSQEKDKKSKDKKGQEKEKKTQENDKKTQENESKAQENDSETSNDAEKETSVPRESRKDKKKELDSQKKEEQKKEAEQKEKEDEPRAKRSRGENKKTEPPPRSPAKRKSKA